MTEPYYTTFEKYIRSNFGNCKKFCKVAKVSPSAVSNWIRGKGLPSKNNIYKIWTLSKDEIGPAYWYTEYVTETKLKIAYLKKKAAELNFGD